MRCPHDPVPRLLAVACAVVLMLAAVLLPGPHQGRAGRGPARPGPGAWNAVPAGAIVVAPGGDDSAAGTAAEPLASIGAALIRVRPGGTVVLRGGSWHESVHLATEGVTLRSWPGEQAWLDGTRALDPAAFEQVGPGHWRMSGYDISLDASPTFTRGAPDNTAPGWRFLDPAYPLAADPQQVWLGDTPLRQAGDLSALEPGTFFADPASRELHLGSDPAGHQLRAGDLVRGLLITAPGVTVRDIGVRRYVPSLPDFGAVTVAGQGAYLTGVTVEDSATIGVSAQHQGITLERLTVRGSGMLGVHAHAADELTLRDLTVTGSNTARFNMAPVAGGAKITLTRGLRVEGGSYSGNRGTGLWLDESVVDSQVSDVDATDNQLHGIHVELCAEADITRAVVARNAGDGIRVQNSDHVRIQQVTAAGNRRQVNFVQDGRRPDDAGASGRLRPGRSGMPTWVLGDSSVTGSVLAAATGAGPHATISPGEAMFGVEDFTRTLDAAALRIALRGNVYLRDERAPGTWTHVWTRPGDDPAVFGSVPEFRAATGQDTGSAETGTGRYQTRSGFPLTVLTPRIARPAPGAGRALPRVVPLPP